MYLDHKVVKNLIDRTKTIYMNSSLWTCGGIGSTYIVDKLRKYK